MSDEHDLLGIESAGWDIVGSNYTSCIPTGHHSTWRTVLSQLHGPAVILHSDPPTQLPTWSRAQEPISETTVFALPNLLHGTVCQTISTILLTLIYLNAISKLNFSQERIVTNFDSTLDSFVNGAIQILYCYYYYYWLLRNVITLSYICDCMDVWD